MLDLPTTMDGTQGIERQSTTAVATPIDRDGWKMISAYGAAGLGLCIASVLLCEGATPSAKLAIIGFILLLVAWLEKIQ